MNASQEQAVQGLHSSPTVFLVREKRDRGNTSFLFLVSIKKRAYISAKSKVSNEKMGETFLFDSSGFIH